MGELPLRFASAAVLAPAAIAATILGGVIFVAFWALAALAVLWEWTQLTRVAGAGTKRLGWVAAGIIYASAIFIAPLVLRADSAFGIVALLFLFAVVWATDILGYAAGRLIGGPRLAPAVSPKKTWSGAMGGLTGAAMAGYATAAVADLPARTAVVALALGLSVASQAGDLFESSLKRRFGAKDASGLIPGHGGVMDRLDGFVVAATIAAILGAARAGPSASAHGLLLW